MRVTFTPRFSQPTGERKHRWPGYLFGGRVRTSTLVLIAAFLVLWWVYDTYGPQQPKSGTESPTQVVPPGFVPDPNYTWVPRTQVRKQPLITTATPTTTSSAPPETTTTTNPPPLPFQLPPPFGPGTTSPPASAPPPQPGQAPTPTSPPPG